MEIIGQYRPSIAAQLQPTIATWYVTFRAIAFVGLLSVLVYIGIKIILVSAAADKATYKKMLVDWLIAMCLLFFLHYIMAFIMTIITAITDLFADLIFGAYGEDALMSNIRNSFDTVGGFGQYGAYAIMYMVLVIFTVIFTIQYLKRVLWMALFTMMAPFIALTYPLDKMKGGRTSTSISKVV